MRKLLTIFSCLATVLLSQAQTPAQRGEDESAMRAMVKTYIDARELADNRAVEALFTSDADQLVSSGEWRKGRDALVRGVLESSRTTTGTRTVTVETIRFVSPDVAIADGRYEISGTPGGETRRMWSTFLFSRTPEGWRIAAIRNMLPAPPVR